ncbi:multidrug transporter [Streptomyces sp. NPDC059913]|uniref:multidrug transporter n=1 Tax=unclassified Streptomyces TaxID=2593676 RepID=UPI00365BC396
MTPATRSRTALLNRLRTLALVEAADAVLIGWVVFAAFGAPASAANTVGFALTAGLLLTGSAYWALKHRQLRTGAALPPAIGAFRPLRSLCALALLAGPFVIAVPAVQGRPPSHWAPGLLLYGLALAEYVNYFHRQLMHDTRADWRRLLRTRRPRRSHLAADLRAHRDRRR